MTHEPTSDQPGVDPDYGYRAQRLLTRQYGALAVRAYRRYGRIVRLGERDNAILVSVAAFGSMKTDQIIRLFFSEAKSRTTPFNALKRLKLSGALASVPLTTQRGARGGSAMGCYQIGPACWQSFYPGTRYKPVRDQFKLEHTLLVVDTYIQLLDLAKLGRIAVDEYRVESDAWETVAGVELHPDLYVALDLKRRREKVDVFFEVDRANENKQQIIDKVNRYIHVYNSGRWRGDGFPEVWFLATSEDRVRSLRRYIGMIDNVPRGLIDVMTTDDLPAHLL